jgi:hypothetical protein
MSKQDNLTDFLTDVADAIREKKGTTEKINPQNFSEEIRGIESGGGWDFLGDIDSLRDNFFTHTQTGRTYVKVDVRDYSYLKVEIDFKGDYRVGFNIVSSYDTTAADNIYDSGWIYSNGYMGVYLIALNDKNSNYLRAPFTLKSSLGALDYEEIKAVYTFKVYGAKIFNWGKEDIADVNHATKSFIWVSMPTRAIEFGEKLESVESIFKSMRALDTVIFHSKTPPHMINNIGNASNYTIYVPDESVEAYKSATNWSNHADRIKPLSEYVEPTTE